MEKEDLIEKDDKYRPLVIAFIIITLIWVLSYFVIMNSIKNWGDRGTFGDMFGAINSLFSGLALAGIIYTILLQRKELALQRMELIETRRELKRSADAQEKSEKALTDQIISMKITAKLNALNSLVDSYGKEEELFRNSNSVTSGHARSRKIHYLDQIEITLKALNNF